MAARDGLPLPDSKPALPSSQSPLAGACPHTETKNPSVDNGSKQAKSCSLASHLPGPQRGLAQTGFGELVCP